MYKRDDLAIFGGSPARTRNNPPMFPGGMEIDEREEQAVLEVLRSKHLFRYYGPIKSESKVESFEKKFAEVTGVKYALGLNSCTSALTIALLAAGIQPGDEVIVPAYTFVATATAVLAANAIPVIVEIDDSFTIDPIDIERNITPRTKAIIPVHMRGVPCDMDAIMDIAGRYGLKVIEDVAQACGGTYKGKPLGSIGDVGCFSFQFHKIITAGEGGAITTNDKHLINRAKALHDTGANWRGNNTIDDDTCPSFPGYNFRMNELTGAILLVQLEKRAIILANMKNTVSKIQEAIKSYPGVTLRRLNDPDGDLGISIIFTVENRAKALEIAKALKAEGLDAGTMGDHTVPDWHIYMHWDFIFNKHGNNDSGYPFTLTDRKYSKDMCPKTLGLLQKVIHMYISPRFTDEDLVEIVNGLQKVLSILL
jgi:8-amino-3,8-dideoxy-alpha-D-manno-octulosonate transaminase